MKVNTFHKEIIRNKMINKVGLDSDILFALIDDETNFSMFKPKIFNRNNFVHISYLIFAQVFGILKYQKGYNQEEIKNKIFKYLRENNIKLIKKSDIEHKREEIELIKTKLKKYRDSNHLTTEDSDVEIIAVYKVENIDLIFTRNYRHFKPLCDQINIDVEKPIDNVNTQMRDMFGWKKRN